MHVQRSLLSRFQINWNYFLAGDPSRHFVSIAANDNPIFLRNNIRVQFYSFFPLVESHCQWVDVGFGIDLVP